MDRANMAGPHAPPRYKKLWKPGRVLNATRDALHLVSHPYRSRASERFGCRHLGDRFVCNRASASACYKRDTGAIANEPVTQVAAPKTFRRSRTIRMGD